MGASKTVTIKLPVEVERKVKAKAEAERRSVSAQICVMLESVLKREEEKK